MNVKIAVVAIAGPISGSMTLLKIFQWPQPSIRAASSSSLGMPRMNWTIKNTKNASVARNLGKISGTNVFTQPSWLKTMYCGTTTTWKGSMIVNSMMANHSDLSRNCSRANAYAASVQANKLPAIPPMTTMAELMMYWPNGLVSAYQPWV